MAWHTYLTCTYGGYGHSQGHFSGLKFNFGMFTCKASQIALVERACALIKRLLQAFQSDLKNP